jgi:Rrf2 family nitric oxide-sensitive transcriptional repressor
MQLTRYTDYALRVLIYLAHEDDGLATIGEIAHAYEVSENHLMKVVHGLGKLGYVTTVRGKGGGMKLARPPSEINLGDVVRNTEETLHVVECLAADYDNACRITSSCRLKGVLKDAHDAFFRHLDQFSIADLIPPKRGAVAPIRFHPRPGVKSKSRTAA